MYLHTTILTYLHTIPLFTVALILHTEGIFCYKHDQTRTVLLSPVLVTGSASPPPAGQLSRAARPCSQTTRLSSKHRAVCLLGQPGILLYICSAWGFLRPTDLVSIFKNLSSHCFAIELLW